MKRLQVNVSDELAQKIEEYCKNLGVSVSQFVAIRLGEFFDNKKELNSMVENMPKNVMEFFEMLSEMKTKSQAQKTKTKKSQ